MKRLVKITAVTAALSIILAVPAFAAIEPGQFSDKMVNNTDKVSAQIDHLLSFAVDDASTETLKELVNSSYASYNKGNAEIVRSYMTYLTAFLSNKREMVRIRKQNIGSLEDLVKVNPNYKDLLEKEKAELEKALADEAKAQENIEFAKEYLAMIAEGYDKDFVDGYDMDEVAGKYTTSDADGTYTLILKADGTGTYDAQDIVPIEWDEYDVEVNGCHWYYSYADGKLVLDQDGIKVTYTRVK